MSMSAHAGMSRKSRRSIYLLLAFLCLATITYFLFYDEGISDHIQEVKILHFPGSSTPDSTILPDGDVSDKTIDGATVDLSKGVLNNGTEEADANDSTAPATETTEDDSAEGVTDGEQETVEDDSEDDLTDDWADNIVESNTTDTAPQTELGHEYLAFCMVVKDQALDLSEFFIHHYYNMGVRRFYIMDDGSIPPLSSVEDYGIPREAITFNYHGKDRHEQYMQIVVYNECARLYGANHTWMAFVDADEFFDTPGNETFQEVLESFEHNETVGAVAVNWRVHTSAGLLHRPGSNRKAFNSCVWDDVENNGAGSNNKHVKVAVKTSAFKSCFSPHQFNLKDGTETVGEFGDIVGASPWRAPITRERLAIHHYELKSREQFEQKMNRSNAMSDPKGWKFWDALEATPQVACHEMEKYEP